MVEILTKLSRSPIGQESTLLIVHRFSLPDIF
jgi:hypothetical protein